MQEWIGNAYDRIMKNTNLNKCTMKLTLDLGIFLYIGKLKMGIPVKGNVNTKEPKI